MIRPILNELETSRDYIEAFGGYNHNLRTNDAEFYDMINMSSSNYPVISPRAKRGVFAPSEGNAFRGIIAKDALCYVNGASFYIGSHAVSGLTLDADTEKTLISMGAYVIILPDKKWVNTAPNSQNTFDFGNIEASWQQPEDTVVTFIPCDSDGNEVTVASGDSAPASPENGTMWLDTSVSPNSMKIYVSTSSMWTSVATAYVKIFATGIAANFSEGDGVTVSGVADPNLADLNSTMTVQRKLNENAIVVIGLLGETKTQTYDPDAAQGSSASKTPVKVARLMPKMDHVCECNNRLWGCRYGLNINGDFVNEIYASKLGDFKNWNCFAGVSTDSYAVSCGTDGQWTGAVTYGGYPMFFKENCFHKIYGNYPSNYQSTVTECRGVEKGSERSLAVVNEVLYYKSRSGIMAYDGSLPSEVSSYLGNVRYTDAVGGANGRKYYISMKESGTTSYRLFVYDTEKGLWHREEDTRFKAVCYFDGEFYFIDSSGAICTVNGSYVLQDAGDVEWMLESGNFGFSMADRKYISRILVRLSIPTGGYCKFYFQYDSDGFWKQVGNINGTGTNSFSIPLRPRRCDHFKLKMVGKGDARIYSIAKTWEQGSDLR